ncbi:TetR/AcrR family transcriptional regulator [Paractinoplanes globisporus]|uniref:TetR/AcrR family transcriptional regulator n=1 Tax=Paractinoplanes globisporus TaxID=113565 RepID=A0ABW6WWE8_9ACTN|nr:TetR/AcrR family transcriptional regulator [Actinoplanes globisporus]
MGLREEKKARTRAALVGAASRLFAEKGYDGTTVADIAAAAGVSTRTFFGYFRAKEDVLFAGTDARLAAMAEAFGEVRPESPLAAVHQIVERVLAASDDLADTRRMAVMLARPELRAQAMERLIAAQRLIAEWLRRGYPDRLDDTRAGAAAGALVGALVGAILSPGRSDKDVKIGQALTLVVDGLKTLNSPGNAPE